MPEKIKENKKLKILIIRLKPIGDTVLISPVFRNLKKLYPGINIIHLVVDTTEDEPEGWYIIKKDGDKGL